MTAGRRRGMFIGVSLLMLLLLSVAWIYLVKPPEAQTPSCSSLPAETEASAVFAKNAPVVERLTQSKPGAIDFELDTHTCPGKGLIRIFFNGREDRERVKKELGDSFFGIPYTMHNV